jgi:ribosomal protein S27E
MASDMSSERVTCAQCGTVIDDSPGTAIEDRRPCPNCGSTTRVVSMTGTIVAKAVVTAEMEVIPAPPPAAPPTEQMEEAGFKVTWYSYPDGKYLVQVHDDAGNLIDGGGGDDPEDMILEVAERLLP